MNRRNLEDVKVLIVDDFATMRRIVKASLKALAISNVSEAEDGVAAIEKLRAEPFDLILSDCNMPNMSGLELLRAVRADENLKDTVFILMTSEGQEEQVLEMAKAGINDYVIKPFKKQELDAKIRRHLGV